MIVSWGELLWDRFPQGKFLGGAAANLAYHASALGARAVLVSRVGADALGVEATDSLKRAGVGTAWIQTDPVRPTGTVSVDFSTGEPSYVITPNVAWDNLAWREELRPVLERAAVFCFGTLAQRTPVSQSGLLRTLAALPRQCRRFCDLNLREPFVTRAGLELALCHADVVKLNLNECASVARLFALEVGAKADSATLVARWLLQEHALQLVVITRGARGSLLFTPTECHEHGGVPLLGDAGDSVGAGDAFAAVVAVALAALGPEISQAELARLSERANRYASYVASRPGAMPPSCHAELLPE